ASQPIRFWANKYKTKFNEDPGVFSVYGYQIMDNFIQGAQRAGASLTTDSFIKAMNSAVIAPDMFGSDTLKFSATHRLGTERSRLSQIQDGRWKVVSDYFK
ncbi:MAG TPA: ABC transporter substrate-binding protein, partial [Ottowia sp.]|nr:ABC transporter substrate-binding protein [Ottowia sp.]